jgi:ferrochelatase
MAPDPYDALLLLSFGGPETPDEVVPFLRRVTAGRGIPDERLREVGAHYFHFDGVSPINAQNRSLVEALEPALAAADLAMPVYWGNLFAEPFIPDAVDRMRSDGVRRALSFTTSLFSSGPGCRRYREAAARAIDETGAGAPTIDRLRHGFDHPGVVEPFVEGVVSALESMPPTTRLAFTTHSIPLATAAASGPPGVYEQGAYVAQHRALAELVAHAASERSGRELLWDLVFQSRSGPPSVPWLEPDISDHLAELVTEGVEGVVVVPIGFVSDHMEVQWDLDTQARADAERLGIAFQRVPTPGIDPRFVAMIVDLVGERVRGVPDAERAALSPLGPSWDTCADDCCLARRPAAAQRP